MKAVFSVAAASLFATLVAGAATPHHAAAAVHAKGKVAVARDLLDLDLNTGILPGIDLDLGDLAGVKVSREAVEVEADTGLLPEIELEVGDLAEVDLERRLMGTNPHAGVIPGLDVAAAAHAKVSRDILGDAVKKLKGLVGLEKRDIVANVVASLPLNPLDIDLKALAVGGISPRYMTNGQRMARGLPPKVPAVKALPSVTAPALPKRSAAPSNQCVKYTGTLAIVADVNATVLGYVAAAPNKYGQFGLCTDVGLALSVSLSVREPNTPFDIMASNGASDFPFFGAIVGHASKFVDLLEGSFNYVALGGVVQCAVNAIPTILENAFSWITGIAKEVESAIWTLGVDLTLVLNWTNSNGAVAVGKLLYVATEDALMLTGDVDAFRAGFGLEVDLAAEVSLKLVVSEQIGCA